MFNKGYSCDVTDHRLIVWVAKDGWHHCKARAIWWQKAVLWGRGRMQLAGLRTVHGVMWLLDFQEAHRFFLADGGGVDLLGKL